MNVRVIVPCLLTAAVALAGDVAWSDPTLVPGVESPDTPTICEYQGRLLMFFVNKKDMLHMTTFGERGWGPARALNVNTRRAPAVAVYRDKLHLVVIGKSSEHLYLVVYDGREWTVPLQITGAETKEAPAIAVFDNALHMVYNAEKNSKLLYMRYDGGWTPPTILAGRESVARPALVTFDGVLQMIYRHGDSTSLVRATYDGRTWSPATRVPDIASKDGPAAAAVGRRLHIVAKSASSGLLEHVSWDGNDWSPPTTATGQEARSDASITPFAEDEALLQVIYINGKNVRHCRVYPPRR
jgi:hypothetical protein